MPEEIMEYARKRIRENGIKVVHCPEFGCRGDVDAFIRIAVQMSQKGVEAKRGRIPTMTNKEVSEIFKDIYNRFWMKHRDNLPGLHDEAGWDSLHEEARELMGRHGCQLARDMVADLVVVMDQRARKGERHGS